MSALTSLEGQSSVYHAINSIGTFSKTSTLEGLKAHIFLILILASGITASIRINSGAMLGILSCICAKPSSLTVCSSEFSCSCAAQCSKSTKLHPVLLRTAATPVRHRTHYVKYGVFHYISKHNSKVNGIKLLGKKLF